MITNANRNHPAVVIVTACGNSNNRSNETTSGSTEDDSPLQKEMEMTFTGNTTTNNLNESAVQCDDDDDDVCASNIAKSVGHHCTDSQDVNCNQDDNDKLQQQQQQHELLHEVSEQSNASTIASVVSVLTPQGAVMRQQQQQETGGHHTLPQSQELVATRQNDTSIEVTCPTMINRRQLRILQSVTQSTILMIREISPSTPFPTSSIRPLQQQPLQHPPTSKWHQNNDIATQMVPLFHSSSTSSFQATTASHGNHTAVQQLCLDLQRHSYHWTMMESTTITARSDNDTDSSTRQSRTILDQWLATVCRGITTPDVGAIATFALLSALCTLMETDEKHSVFHQRHLQQIFNAVIRCVFEESSTTIIDNTTLPINTSQWNVSEHTNSSDKKGASIITPTVPTMSSPAPTVALPSRRRASTMSIPAPAGPSEKEPPSGRNLPPRPLSFYESRAVGLTPTNTLTNDELAVYKLLQLISILVPKWNPKGLEQQDQSITGLLDLCWHILCKSQQATATSRILQQLAMDTEVQIIRSILLHHCSNSKIVVIQHAFSRVSKHLLLLNQSVTASTTKSSTANQDAAIIDLSLGTVHNSFTTTTHCLSVVKLIVRLMDIENFRSDEIGDCTEESSTPDMNSVVRQAIRSIITVAMSTNHTTILQSCIQVVNEFLSVVGLASLKCEFEVFLQAVLLRRLTCTDTTDSQSISIAEKEIVLEYVQDICLATHTASSPAAVSILDLYVNYDCDCMCSNVFETIMSTVSKIARPANWAESDVNTATVPRTSSCDPDPSISTIHKTPTGGEVSVAPIKSASIDSTANGYLHRMALNCILSALEFSEQIANQNAFIVAAGTSCSKAEACDESMIYIKKAKKRSLDKVVQSFNAVNPDKGEWLTVAVKEDLLMSSDDPVSVAKLLFMVPMNIDKQRVGIYLSRGPESDYPFQALLRTQFVALFDFQNMSFPKSLRKYLSKFRLPGEAQCIDRLMEVFSKEYFEQHKESTMFKNADAVFVLAFSTIMLNTDLHNPTIKADRRMTLEEFLRNNSGINSGDNLPDEYLSDLYDQIKERELQLITDQLPINNVGRIDAKIYWDEIYDRRGIADTAIRLSEGSRQKGCKTLSNDFLVESMNLYVPALVGTFLASTDDMITVRALRAIQQILKLATEAKLDCAINAVLQTFLAVGQEYISKQGADDEVYNSPPLPAFTDHPRQRRNLSIDSVSMSEDLLLGIKSREIPYGLLCSRTDDDDRDAFAGCSEHRGLLALDCCFVFIRNNISEVNEAWPAFVKCLCMLRDIRALPKSLSDLDDFADSNGNVLPLSSFALESQKRVHDHHRTMNDKENPKQKGWFRSFFRKSKIDDQVSDAELNATPEVEQSINAKALLAIAESSNVEAIVQMGSSKIPYSSIGLLLDILDQYPFENDPVGEQHAIFTVELAARALLSQHDRAETLFMTFLSKFELLLCKATAVEGDIPDAPFIIERIVVTVLRCCIHLYEYPKLRPHLRASLQLLTMTLPRSFIHVVANRMSCGLAIILRASYHYFEDQQEWSFMNDMLDALAHYETSRVFVFDGIASTVEHAMPNFNPNSNVPSSSCYHVTDAPLSLIVSDEDDRHRQPPCLSIEACNVLSRVLIRFVLNYYQGDHSLMVPAMLCLEKVYRRKVEILLKQQQQQQQPPSNQVVFTDDSPTIDIVSNAPDPDLWQNVAVAIYSVCRSSDAEASTAARKCFQRIVVRTNMDQIDNATWVTMLFLMVHKQPTVISEVSRANTFSVLGQLMLRIVPSLSHQAEYREDMEEFVLQFAALAEENIHSSISSKYSHDRGGAITTVMLDKTVQTLTYICNHILSDGWDGDREFSVWMNETFLTPLELSSTLTNSAEGRGHGKVVVTTFDNQDELDDVSEISDSVAGEEY